MKSSYVLLIFLLFTTTGYAQRSFFSQSFEFLVPTGSVLPASTRNGFGTSFRYEIFVKGKFNAIASVGYLSFGKKTLHPNTAPIYTLAIKSTMVPIQVGARFLSFEHRWK
jgi:hypothetical protein